MYPCRATACVLGNVYPGCTHIVRHPQAVGCKYSSCRQRLVLGLWLLQGEHMTSPQTSCKGFDDMCVLCYQFPCSGCQPFLSSRSNECVMKHVIYLVCRVLQVLCACHYVLLAPTSHLARLVQQLRIAGTLSGSWSWQELHLKRSLCKYAEGEIYNCVYLYNMLNVGRLH